jgi:hypothetical protein
MNMLDTEMRTAADGRQLYSKKSIICFTGENEYKIRECIKATVRSSEKKCYVNRRDLFH